MKLLLSELLQLMVMIQVSEVLEHADPDEVIVILSRRKDGSIKAELSGKEWRN